LCEYDGAGSYKRLFIYGNYIDEVLYTAAGTPGTRKYYVHDHLYSPVALVFVTGAVQERYEYDAYGRCCVLDPDFTIDADGSSDYDNPYLFTGRRWDILNNGSLKIQYSRNRYYDYHTGRFLTHDPLGITPNPPVPNYFYVTGQYKDGLSLYEYVRSNPVVYADVLGLYPIPFPPPVYSQPSSTSDIGFFVSFWKHRYFGFGRLWTSGASRLKEQSGVKEPTTLSLQIFAMKRCKELPINGKCYSTGPVKEDIPRAFANDTIGMRASLFGPHRYFVRGTYAARKDLKGGHCVCTVSFSNNYVWDDMGDRNLDWWADRLLGYMERITMMDSLAMDFPVHIMWRASSSCTITKGSISYTGWPFN